MTSGHHRPARVRTYPDDCVQAVIQDPSRWWVPDEAHTLCRGALLYCFVAHSDQVPYQFEPVGRTVPTEHGSATVKVSPLKVGEPLKPVTALPVAALSLKPGEVWAAYRAKRRPCIVISDECPTVDRGLTKGMPNATTAPTMLVAPFYGADKDGSRAGFNDGFIDRIRHCEYPQFMWDQLPLAGGPQASILRLDQIQPIGRHYHSYKACGWKLSDDALAVFDDLIHWQIWGGVPEGSDLIAFRELMRDTYS